MTRRSFVCGATSLLATGPRCGREQSRHAGGTECARPEDLLALQSRLEGKLVLPADPAYEQTRLVHSARFDDVRPSAIALCRSNRDVSESIRWARERGVRLVPRSGGHHYLGGSTSEGLVVDTGALNAISVDPGSKTMLVGAGTRSFDIVGALAPHRLALPMGSCPSVGIAGLTLGGGKGFSGRKLGMTCDNLIEAEVVLASGEVVVCSERSEPDLFWACRGGGGGTFGIATAFRFDVHPVDVVCHFQIDWQWQDAIEVFASWSELALRAPDDLFVRLQIGHEAGKKQLAWMGQYFGPADRLRSLLAGALASPAGRRAKLSLHEGTFVDAALEFGECKDDDLAACRAKSAASRKYFLAKSDYFDAPLDAAAVELLLARFESAAESVGGWEGMQLDPVGGRIGRIGDDETAFPHRHALAVAQYLFYWDPSVDRERLQRSQAGFRKVYDDLRPHASGGAYQNHPDQDLVDWGAAYFGSNLARLRRVKSMYDEDGFFSGPQTISR